MTDSKWNFIAVGVAGLGAFLSALSHAGIPLLLNLFFVVLNWYAGADKRKMEEVALIAEYEIAKAEADKDTNEETDAH